VVLLPVKILSVNSFDENSFREDVDDIWYAWRYCPMSRHIKAFRNLLFPYAHCAVGHTLTAAEYKSTFVRKMFLEQFLEIHLEKTEDFLTRNLSRSVFQKSSQGLIISNNEQIISILFSSLNYLIKGTVFYLLWIHAMILFN